MLIKFLVSDFMKIMHYIAQVLPKQKWLQYLVNEWNQAWNMIQISSSSNKNTQVKMFGTFFDSGGKMSVC